MTAKIQANLDAAVSSLRREVGENLHSCCVYGSAVRGNFVDGLSDLNLLIVLNRSTAEAHEAVGRALENLPRVDPFVLARRGFERSVRAFASKFASIRRNYQVLAGADPLAAVIIDPLQERFLCEQAIRNLRLRLVYAYVTRGREKRYGRFVMQNITVMFVQFSEVLRLSGTPMPQSFEDRLPVLGKEFGFDSAVLLDLLNLRKSRAQIQEKDAAAWHARLFPVVDAVLFWIESHWNE